jgi:hypothetical protein
MKPTASGIGGIVFLASFVAAGAMFLSPVNASQCPLLMSQIEEALKVAQIDDTAKAQIFELLSRGKAEHEGGNHDASIATLNEALKLLGK